MNENGRLTTSYRKQRAIGPLHTGGPVIVTSDARRVVTCVGEQAILTNVESGEEICRFYNDTSSITAIALSPSEKELVIVTSSLSIRIYTLPALYSSPLTKPLEPVRHIPKAHEAPVHVVIIDPSSSYIATGSADGVAKVWDLRKGYITHVFKGHGGVISCLQFYLSTSQGKEGGSPQLTLATGSVDTRVRLFNLSDANQRSTSAKANTILDGHVSVPRGMAFSSDGKWLLTAGRDSVVLVWDLSSQGKPSSKAKGDEKPKKITPWLWKTIPVSDTVEALGIIDQTVELHGVTKDADSLHFFIAGEKGQVQIWDAHKGKALARLGESREKQSSDAQELQSILECIYCKSASVVVAVHADQNIVFHSLKTFSIIRQLIGFNDEIVDAVFLTPPSNPVSPKESNGHAEQSACLALATNSSLLRVYSTLPGEGLNAYLLAGHADTVLALACSSDGRVLASGGKDKSIRIWVPRLDSNQRWVWGCTAVGEGHMESIGALAISKVTTDGKSAFLATGSQDRTIKLWSLEDIFSSSGSDPNLDHDEPNKLKSLLTQKAHEKDINSLDISPNNRLLATGSQDKTAKIFEIEHQKGGRITVNLVGTLKGHKRGIWNVKFSGVEKIIATASGDKSIKLWNLDDYSCIKTLEGHTNSVLRVNFINNGQQLLSTSSDGLMKLWNIRSEECVASMDNHEDKVWALAVSGDGGTVVTAAADSAITFWTDSTEVEQREKDEKLEELVAKEQDLANYIVLQDYKNAIFLALSMDHPRRLYNLFSAVASSRVMEATIDLETGETIETGAAASITGNPAVDEVVRTLPATELSKLLLRIRDWNATAKTSGIAQLILHAVVKLRPAEDLRRGFNQRPTNLDNEMALDADNEGVSGDKAGQQSGSNTTTKRGEGLQEVVEALIPYTERHLARTDRLVQDTYILDFLLSEMDGGIAPEDTDDMMQLDA